MLRMIRLRRGGLAIDSGVANRYIAQRPGGGNQRCHRHRDDRDHLTPGRKPCYEKADCRFHS
jgi:hypothetical protein